MRKRCALLIVLIGIAGCGRDAQQPPVNPLPAAAEIDWITAELRLEDRDPAVFTISPAQWPTVLEALLPAKLDPYPANWQMLASLKVQLTDGKRLFIELFEISDGPGAFAIETKSGQRTYYRGGDSAKLGSVLGEIQKSEFFHSGAK
jgi:hypothetical protein